MHHLNNQKVVESNRTFVVPGTFREVLKESSSKTCDLMATIDSCVSSIHPEAIQKIATGLGMSFVPHKEKESEVCFINSEEVRPEFKLSFAPVDVFHYVSAMVKEQECNGISSTNDELLIPYPKDAVEFWERVKKGEENKVH